MHQYRWHVAKVPALLLVQRPVPVMSITERTRATVACVLAGIHRGCVHEGDCMAGTALSYRAPGCPVRRL